jgi:hypothetical protein
MATVVDALIRSAAEVIFRSVETTSISLTERINSVFPALNGPVRPFLLFAWKIALDKSH